MNKLTATAPVITSAPTPHHATFKRDLWLTMAAGYAFFSACSASNGWLLPVICYVIAAAALFSTIQRHSAQPASRRWVYLINALACSGLLAALWFSGRMAVLF